MQKKQANNNMSKLDKSLHIRSVRNRIESVFRNLNGMSSLLTGIGIDKSRFLEFVDILDNLEITDLNYCGYYYFTWCNKQKDANTFSVRLIVLVNEASR